MKALFITGSDFSDETYGGPKGSIRNHLLLKEYFDVDVYLVQKKSTLRSALSVLQGFFPPADSSDLRTVEEMYKENGYSLVFFDGSTYGEFMRLFDRAKTKIAVFYHNCQHDYMAVRFGSKFSLKKAVYTYMNDRSEKMSTDMADVRICLSARDAKRIMELYGKNVQFNLPLTVVDKYVKKDYGVDVKSCLLFGPVASANVEAFTWFVKNVSPHLHCKTIVAGKGFEAYKRWDSDKVEVIGYVESLPDLYGSISCVAIPLLSGGGMKVKTVEAMMFGKSIFGTDEAFVGYDVDYGRIGALCNSADDFIREINSFMDGGGKAFNEYSRNLYAERYCVQASEDTFGQIMRSLGFHRKEAGKGGRE